ncbi:PD-(D/E)XK nuclease family protein [Clostridium sp. SHJSY1]|uniref:PD-(D/E)XK nuclease family protein n=1 Tax=Clostridium sp. SHJSY1 TaxID=2942483 RepID=UPI0028765B63|nr:PD-(D/E)XK nuclease family protein [Clostridium sp. SHJSY1]MDS0525071.1 PD-(D/E)XK nuclease family protein [Clostridium sp. SHJSY1]
MGDWYKVGDYPEKSWSISKMKVLQNCLREYYYTYYGSHKGWIYESGDEQKISWRLKKLTNIWLMFGDKLHEIIKYQIKDNENKISVEQMKVYMRNKLNSEVKASIEKVKTGEWDEYPKGEMLQEYYYEEGLREEVVKEIKERIEICTSALISSKSYNDIKNTEKKILEVDEGKFDSIFVSGIKVYALIDLLYIDENGNYIIVDWKTGKIGEQDKEQLMVYAIYVMERYGVNLDKIIGRIEYLLSGENVEYIFNIDDIEYIKYRIRMDLNVIDAFLEDKLQNKPITKENFLMSENLNKCRKCKFRRLCIN